MIQVALRSIECAASCGATAEGLHRVTAEVVTTYTTVPRTQALGGAGMEYDPAAGPRSLSEGDWAYEDHEPNLYSGFPMKVVVRVTHVASGRVEVGEIRAPRPLHWTWSLTIAGLVVHVEMRVPVRTDDGRLRGLDGRFHFGVQQPSDVFVFRADSDEYMTVSMQLRRARLEINPVYPPWVYDVKRPKWTHAVESFAITPRTHVHGVTYSSPSQLARNVVLNPAVIPRVDSPSATTAAPVQVTRYFPRGLDFTEGDARLRWRASSVAGGGQVTFVGDAASRDRGRRVLVAGVSDGEIQLELSFNHHPIARYRALVRPIVRIPYRVVLLRCPGVTGFAEASTLAADIWRANLLLRQVCVELVPDTAPPAQPGMSPTDAPGVFVAMVQPPDTVGVQDAVAIRVCTFDARPNVVNFAVVHSRVATSAHGTWQAVAVVYPESTWSGTTITDRGVPGTSWLGSTGIPPSTEPSATTMEIGGASVSRRSDVPGPLVGLTVAADTTYQAESPGYRAQVLAHELCHTLNLLHRAAPSGRAPDGVPRPQQGNIMNWWSHSLHNDLDIVQARAIWESHLVKHYLANPLPSS